MIPVLPTRESRVDERDLAEARSAFVHRDVRPHQLLALVGAHLDGAAALEAHLEAAHDRALDLQRIGGADGALDAAGVRGREDLLGRHVRDVLDAARLVERRLPAGVRMEADRQVGARARGSGARRSARSLSAAARRPSFAMCSRHAATGSGSSSRTAVATASQSRSTSGSPKTASAQPSFGNATIDQLQRPSLSRRLASATSRMRARADAAAVEVGEELGLRVAGDREQRAALLAEVVQALDEPRRREAELVLGGVLDVRAADVLVGVEDVDEARAGRVRLACDRPHERLVLDERVDREQLAGLQVEPDLDRQPGVRLQSVVGRCHVGGQSTSRRRVAPGSARGFA